MKNFWTNLTVHWKSSANGLLVFLIATTGVLEQSNVLEGKWAAAIVMISGLARAYVGIISQDAGKQLSIMPGSDVPVALDSHETPNRLGARAVINSPDGNLVVAPDPPSSPASTDAGKSKGKK